MEEQVDHQNQEEENTLINFLDSVDDYLVLIDSLSNTLLRQVIHSFIHHFILIKGGVIAGLFGFVFCAYFASFWLI